MPSDYASIKGENERRYGTDIGRIGPMLLADRYDDRTHFIYELLQNAEDALARRDGWSGVRAVAFELSGAALRISHFGAPFTEADVRGICGIAKSTKGLTSIGLFGIGFKSVYAFTDCPEIHSGEEHFAVDSFVWPRAIPMGHGDSGETTFILPLRPADASAHEEIAAGLRRLGARTLLFLREIEEISWSVEGGASGLYRRTKPEPLGGNARKVMVIGEGQGAADVTEETWLVFSRQVRTGQGVKAGYVEVAFALSKSDGSATPSVRPIDDSALVVFFPTIVPTNLGLLLQGPYRTTPSRDNVPRNDPWNQHLVRETVTLLVEALCMLRDNGLLDASALRSLPLDPSKFGEGSMFAPLFRAVREALSSEPLLPRFGGGHVPARAARLGRTRELRELFSPAQLASIFQMEGEIAWISEDITQDRTPELRRYLMEELGVVEVAPETILSRLTKSFLETQSDEWIVQLYEFLNGQPALQRQGRLSDVPLVRLESGEHVTACKNSQPLAFLPAPVSTGFPTVRRAVCGTDAARTLLTALGLTEPDPVDDVIRNVLPKYHGAQPCVSPTDYAADIQRMVNAFGTDSKSRRDALVSALRECPFVAAVGAGTGIKNFALPTQVYLATERLKALFKGVPSVLLVDDSHECLRGERIRELLEACGATRYLQPVPVDSQFTWKEKREMRRKGGCESCSYDQGTEDFTLRGLEELLKTLQSLGADDAKTKAGLLWQALCDVVDRRGARAFSGMYRWTYYHQRSYEFDAAFVRQLNEAAWVPNRDGRLQPPGLVIFEETGWTGNPFLLSKIRFNPPIIEALAREAGIEPGVLDLLKRLGLTSEAELKERLGIKDNASQSERKPGDADLTPEEVIAVGTDESEAGPGPGDGVGSRAVSRSGTDPRGSGASASHKNGTGTVRGGHQGTSPGRSGKSGTSGGDTARPFMSYLGVHPDEDEPDPDGLGQQERMALEEQAITLIVNQEPQLLRTPANNPGFDLIDPGPDGKPARWIEVKAMTGDLHSRPVGLSRTQFEIAQEHGDRYWLYVVERAGSANEARIVRIQNPAGKARTFTFDHGWLSVAEVSDPTRPDQQEQCEGE
jgi:hypothetical protein